eukprot:2584734-Pyramimonas_sp.AAC.1
MTAVPQAVRPFCLRWSASEHLAMGVLPSREVGTEAAAAATPVVVIVVVVEWERILTCKREAEYTLLKRKRR